MKETCIENQALYASSDQSEARVIIDMSRTSRFWCRSRPSPGLGLVPTGPLRLTLVTLLDHFQNEFC